MVQTWSVPDKNGQNRQNLSKRPCPAQLWKGKQAEVHNATLPCPRPGQKKDWIRTFEDLAHLSNSWRCWYHSDIARKSQCTSNEKKKSENHEAEKKSEEN